MAWSCPLVPKGKTCPYEKYQALGCVKLGLRAALQKLKWELPLVGKTFKTYEHKVECQDWRT